MIYETEKKVNNSINRTELNENNNATVYMMQTACINAYQMHMRIAH